MISSNFMAEGQRLISQKAVGNYSVKVYRDTDWNEFVVRFFENGIHQLDADYYTDDKDDAIDTAGRWLSKGAGDQGLGEAVPVIGATTTTAPATPAANAAPASAGTVTKPMTTQGVEALAQVIKNAGLTPSQLSTVTTLAKK